MYSGQLPDPFTHFEYKILDDFALLSWQNRLQAPLSTIVAVNEALGSVTLSSSLWPQEPLKIRLGEEGWRVVLSIVCWNGKSIKLGELCYFCVLDVCMNYVSNSAGFCWPLEKQGYGRGQFLLSFVLRRKNTQVSLRDDNLQHLFLWGVNSH